MSQESTINTVITGEANVEIQGVGSFIVSLVTSELGTFAAHAHAFLTGKPFSDYTAENFELVSADPGQRKLVFRIKKGAPISQAAKA